jgi:transcriptional regulator with XRE-family HTH domain
MIVGNTLRSMKDDQALRNALGRVFADIRMALGVSQGDTLEQATVSKVESGANFPSWPTMLALCRRYRVSLHDVLHAAEEAIGVEGERSVVAVAPDEREILRLYRDCTAEGRRVYMDRAKAVHTLYPKG